MFCGFIETNLTHRVGYFDPDNYLWCVLLVERKTSIPD